MVFTTYLGTKEIKKTASLSLSLSLIYNHYTVHTRKKYLKYSLRENVFDLYDCISETKKQIATIEPIVDGSTSHVKCR